MHLVSNTDSVIIIGYSGHAFVALDIFELVGQRIAGYCDQQKKVSDPFNLPYFGTEQDLFQNNSFAAGEYQYFIGIGENSIRKRVFDFLTTKQTSIVNALHPRAILSSRITMGRGVLIAASATINPLVILGDGVICNTSSSIDHECTIGNFSHICPGTVLCGNVTIGENCFIGANSVVRQGVTICDNVIIGAGSTVVKDISVPGTYFGNYLRAAAQ